MAVNKVLSYIIELQLVADCKGRRDASQCSPTGVILFGSVGQERNMPPTRSPPIAIAMLLFFIIPCLRPMRHTTILRCHKDAILAILCMMSFWSIWTIYLPVFRCCYKVGKAGRKIGTFLWRHINNN